MVSKISTLKIFIIAALVVFVLPNSGLCRWDGPSQVISLKFGTGLLEAGKEEQDYPWTEFPEFITMDDNGNVIVGDQINKKILIFDTDGKNIGVIKPNYDTGASQWPNELFVISNEVILVVSGGNFQVFSYKGKLIKNIHSDESTFEDYLYGEGFILNDKDEYNIKYTLNGEVISKIKQKRKTLTNYTFDYNTINNRNYDYGIFERGNDHDFDVKRINLDISSKLVVMYSPCGKKISEFEIPDNVVFEGETPPKGEEQYFFDHDLYGGPILTHKGDVITHHITPSTFSILKWTWVNSPDDPKGGPDAPADLKVAPSTDGLSLAWTASPQDPGCVEGYEVERSSGASFSFSNITTTVPGVIKYNDTGAIVGSSYDYRIRAKSSCGPSPYTVVVSGKRL